MTLRRALAVVAAAAVATALCACGKSAPRTGKRATCTCTYLTDFDDTARVDVDVCVEDGREVDAEARKCAANSAHNHIDKCDCKQSGEACDPGVRNACTNR